MNGALLFQHANVTAHGQPERFQTETGEAATAPAEEVVDQSQFGVQIAQVVGSIR